jgi:hypothetical protein
MTAATQGACRICQDLGPHRAVSAREMMFGTEAVRDTFDVITFHHSLEHVVESVDLLRLGRNRGGQTVFILR